MATTNCSYTDNNNVYNELTCAANTFCCSGSNGNTCSASVCTSSTSDNISPTLFWSILGGLFGAGILLICLMYIICKFKAPNSCLSEDHMHDAEMFEEECHEINTVSHQPARHNSRFYIRRESFWKITRRKSTASRPVCSQCKNNEVDPKEASTSTNKTIVTIKNVAQSKDKNPKQKNTTLALPDVA